MPIVNKNRTEDLASPDWKRTGKSRPMILSTKIISLSIWLHSGTSPRYRQMIKTKLSSSKFRRPLRKKSFKSFGVETQPQFKHVWSDPWIGSQIIFQNVKEKNQLKVNQFCNSKHITLVIILRKLSKLWNVQF